MTQDEIIEMARDADLDWHTGWTLDDEEPNRFVTFADLVAAKATEEANARANASWTLMCKKMVANEREACAKLCDLGVDTEHPTVKGHIMKNFGASTTLAAAIRARGEKA